MHATGMPEIAAAREHATLACKSPKQEVDVRFIVHTLEMFCEPTSHQLIDGSHNSQIVVLHAPDDDEEQSQERRRSHSQLSISQSFSSVKYSNILQNIFIII